MKRQREKLSFYKVKCDDPLCGCTFYEWSKSDGKCPMCGTLLAETNIGEELTAVFEIDPFTSKITPVGYERPSNID